MLSSPEEDDDPEVTLVGFGPPIDDNKGAEDAPSNSENGNGSWHRPGRPWDTQDPLRPQRPRH